LHIVLGKISDGERERGVDFVVFVCELGV
jgi:hypothetical protein